MMMDFAHDMEEVCPDAWFLNYTNPMAADWPPCSARREVKTVGLGHSGGLASTLSRI